MQISSKINFTSSVIMAVVSAAETDVGTDDDVIRYQVCVSEKAS